MTDAPQADAPAADIAAGDLNSRPDQPRRIAFCITDLDVGGAEQCLVNVVGRLDRREWTPHVYCLSRRGALVDRLDALGISCTCLDWRGWPDAWRVVSLARQLRAFRPQLLQTFLFHGNIAGRLAGTLAGVPVIVSGIRVAEREKAWHVRLDRWTRGLVTQHVCVSRAVADFSIREARLRPETVSVIPNGVDVERFQTAAPLSNAELGAPPETKWLIAVGRLHPQKGHLLLLEAIAPLLRAAPDWRLMIVGEGPLRSELERRILELGCREQVVLTGFRNDVPRLLRTASILVLPSLWEGLPNVVLEAQAAGLPVVASDVEGIREVIISGQTGLITEAGNRVHLQAALKELMSSPERRLRMKDNLQVHSQSMVTVDFAARMYSDLYRRLL
ncbi:MAG: glycosyltransferase [Planctomycetaceae bacterium]|nr:glycosyltransferase [Planctomycetaceae bacterium]